MPRRLAAGSAIHGNRPQGDPAARRQMRRGGVRHKIPENDKPGNVTLRACSPLPYVRRCSSGPVLPVRSFFCAVGSGRHWKRSRAGRGSSLLFPSARRPLSGIAAIRLLHAAPASGVKPAGRNMGAGRQIFSITKRARTRCAGSHAGKRGICILCPPAKVFMVRKCALC